MTLESPETPGFPVATSRAVPPSGRRPGRNKVPEVTVYFWTIKILCTTVGATVVRLLNQKAGLGLTGVSVLMTALLAVVLAAQFRCTEYRAGVYWPTVALVGTVGTLAGDNLVDATGATPETTSSVFVVALAIVFVVWYRREGTLSIHSIDTTRRESFYWLAVLFAFALGTAAGDLVSERLHLGHWLSAVLFGLAIAAVGLAHFQLDLDLVWSFWTVYVLTRPLGASIGDYLSRPSGDGGLELGTVVTGALFSMVIVGLVVYLAATRVDVTDPEHDRRHVA
ncbi:hypothetical protein ACFV06_00065 [Streptomyces sp. NPDC059618]|uniref:COG4705 family protein n=1 Tax=Streptomyces sp. NPDC059618 TaxID=3346887 RepID=UPI0036748665